MGLQDGGSIPPASKFERTCDLSQVLFSLVLMANLRTNIVQKTAGFDVEMLIFAGVNVDFWPSKMPQKRYGVSKINIFFQRGLCHGWGLRNGIEAGS